MMKRGFTLIELMVVIVIIGILAAIAIPKLFGMTAKAKASEVGPAAGTWSKLQAAYILEVGSTGSFTSIGYKAPGDGNTTNFTYTNPTPASETQADWQAQSKTKLNECEVVDGIWGATYPVATSVQPVVPTSTDCQILTPNFNKLQ